jgi:hypothetical protein
VRAFVVTPPRLTTFGFELADVAEALAPPPPAPDASARSISAEDRGFIRGAVGMARLEAERARLAARRLYAERTKWGFGLLVALALGWLLRGMQP